MSRGLLNDERVAARISEAFVPVSGAIEKLQPSRYGGKETDASRWFETMAKSAFETFDAKAFWDEFGSYQGLYVVGPDGTAYGYKVVWQLTPAGVLSWLDASLARHRASPPAKASITDAAVAAAAPAAPPAGVSVLTVFSRVRPVPQGADPSIGKGVGRDHLWIWAEELRLLASATEKDTPVFPRRVLGRLVRFTLLDHTRNVGRCFESAEVLRVDASLSRGDRPGDWTFTIDFLCEAVDPENGDDGKSGSEGKLEGAFTVDSSAAITKFRAYGEGKAWGRLDTGAPRGKYPVVWALVHTEDAAERAIAPFWQSVSPVFEPEYRKALLPR